MKFVAGAQELLRYTEGIVRPALRRLRRELIEGDFDLRRRGRRGEFYRSVTAGRARDGEPAVDRRGQDDAVIVIGVIPQQLDAAGGVC